MNWIDYMNLIFIVLIGLVICILMWKLFAEMKYLLDKKQEDTKKYRENMKKFIFITFLGIHTSVFWGNAIAKVVKRNFID